MAAEGCASEDQAGNCSGGDYGDVAESKASSAAALTQTGAMAFSAAFMCGSGPICPPPGFACGVSGIDQCLSH